MRGIAETVIEEVIRDEGQPIVYLIADVDYVFLLSFANIRRHAIKSINLALCGYGVVSA